MVEAGKKVNFYRLALQRGKMHRMTLSEDDRLIGEGGGVFGYLAPVFDSMDFECTWHRLRLEGVFSNCKYEIVAAATDENLEEMIQEEATSVTECLSFLKERGHVRKVNTDDMLLHGIQGRYLWIVILVTGAKIDSCFRIEGFSVEFPAKSFIEYLPEIYQQEGRNSFFERYMAVLQSLYEDLEKEIENVPRYLDYETTSDDNLSLFAEWTGHWNREKKWNSKQMRYILKKLQELQSGRGTKYVMEQMIWLITGKKAVILEHFQWEDWMRQKSSLLNEYHVLYGNDEDTFVAMIEGSEKELGISEKMLEHRLKDYTPLGMNCKVVYLKKNSHMDSQIYLDKNSYLSTPEGPSTEGFVLGEEVILE